MISGTISGLWSKDISALGCPTRINIKSYRGNSYGYFRTGKQNKQLLVHTQEKEKSKESVERG
jgi:hypothetical protein